MAWHSAWTPICTVFLLLPDKRVRVYVPSWLARLARFLTGHVLECARLALLAVEDFTAAFDCFGRAGWITKVASPPLAVAILRSGFEGQLRLCTEVSVLCDSLQKIEIPHSIHSSSAPRSASSRTAATAARRFAISSPAAAARPPPSMHASTRRRRCSKP